jgi:hypothetical protein
MKLDPIIQRAYVEQGQIDQVTNTSLLQKNASADQLVPQLLTVVEENKFGKWEISWVKLIDFKDYPALLISNDDNLQSSPIGFGPGVLCLLFYK